MFDESQFVVDKVFSGMKNVPGARVGTPLYLSPEIVMN